MVFSDEFSFEEEIGEIHLSCIKAYDAHCQVPDHGDDVVPYDSKCIGYLRVVDGPLYSEKYHFSGVAFL